jgi:DNA-3-methyladenine glycosylase I
MLSLQRCGWVTADPLYVHYHDEEWGVPVYDRQHLFEMLSLEGQQAGLSWLQVLKRREAYRQHFAHFHPESVAQFTSQDILNLLQKPALIRNKAKLSAIVTNANALLRMENSGESFISFIWSFVDDQPKISNFADYKAMPAFGSEALSLSKALKKRGFNFVGPTICHAFLQACGLLIDHQTNCFCHPKNR